MIFMVVITVDIIITTMRATVMQAISIGVTSPGYGAVLAVVGHVKTALGKASEVYNIFDCPCCVGIIVAAITHIDGKVSVYDASTGKNIWVYARAIPKLTLRGTSAPVVVDDKILAGFSDGRLIGLSLATGELLWETTIAAPRGRTDLERLVDIDGLFQAADGIVYVSSFQGRVSAVTVSDGRVLWGRDMSSYTGLAIGPGQIFVTDAESKVWALDGRTGATLWRQDNLAGRELSTPAVVGDSVAVADYDGFVHWLSRDDGQFVARNNLDATWKKLRYVWDDEEPEDRRRRDRKSVV